MKRPSGPKGPLYLFRIFNQLWQRLCLPTYNRVKLLNVNSFKEWQLGRRFS